MKKYELVKEDTIKVKGKTLYRIKALKKLKNSQLSVDPGCFGGYVESESNLSHEGNCWIDGDAMVFGNAIVYEDASVFGNARVYGRAKVYGEASVYGDAKVYGKSRVCNEAYVFDKANVFGNAKLSGCTSVFGKAKVYGDAVINDASNINGDADVSSNNDYYYVDAGDYFTFFKLKNGSVGIDTEYSSKCTRYFNMEEFVRRNVVEMQEHFEFKDRKYFN